MCATCPRRSQVTPFILINWTFIALPARVVLTGATHSLYLYRRNVVKKWGL